MKLSTAIAPLLLGAAAVTDALSLYRGANQASLISQDESLKVPGDSPLEHCVAGYEDTDLLVLDSVDLSPNPPLAGETLLITASGTVKKAITKGAYGKLTVKYGLITLLTTTFDLCEQLGQVDLSCPLETGKMTITKSVELPKQIPPGKYNVIADVYSNDDESITCLKAGVAFKPQGL